MVISMPHGEAFLVGAVILVALVFDFMNGFHDAANSIATIVSTRVLRPQVAVAWAAFFNLIAFLFFGLHVANTLSHDLVAPGSLDPITVLAALMGAIVWNVITWFYGIPSSSSHALIGGLTGSILAQGRGSMLNLWALGKIALSIILSPLLGFLFAFGLMAGAYLLFFRSTPRKVDRLGRRLQLFSASLYSLGHGGNDAQKTMGIIAGLLYAQAWIAPDAPIPLWVILSCQAAMALGTLFGGWRIVETMGLKITKLKPIGGVCAELGGAITLFFATTIGIPVSTTHTITGAIMGVGAVNKLSAVRWGMAKRIVLAWFITVPASALMSGLAAWCLRA